MTANPAPHKASRERNELREPIKLAFNKLLDDVRPYMKNGVSEDWEAFVAHLQEFGMAYEADREDYARQGVEKARQESAKRLQNQITRYGDGEISYHNGEATVPISKVLAELSSVSSNKEGEQS